MKIDLDVDFERASTQLTAREKMGIKILFLIFALVFPAKYSHQVRDAIADLFK